MNKPQTIQYLTTDYHGHVIVVDFSNTFWRGIILQRDEKLEMKWNKIEDKTDE